MEGEMRVDSLRGGAGELASAHWEQGESVVGEERPQGWEPHLPVPQGGSAAGEFLQGGHGKGRQGVSYV